MPAHKQLWCVESLTRLANQYPEIRAAARYWRERVRKAEIGDSPELRGDTMVKAPLSESELDGFEECLVLQFASALTLRSDCSLFSVRGMDVASDVRTAYCHAINCSPTKVEDKLTYVGFYSRMRILLGKEVSAELSPYRCNYWQTVWSAS